MNIPRLYRYESIAGERFQWLLDTLIGHKVFFPNAALFNDPFDARPHLTFSRDGTMSLEEATALVAKRDPELDEEGQRDLALQMHHNSQRPEVAATIRQQLEEAIQVDFYRTSIRCYCTDPESLTQWAYYADCHRGVRLEFAHTHPWLFVGDDGDQRPVAFTPVQYRDDYPTLEMDVDLDREESKKQFLEGLITKSKDWAGEQEWRGLRVKTRPGHQQFRPQDLISIVLGVRMAVADRDRILEACRTRDVAIDVYQAKLARGAFRIELDNLGAFGGPNG
jgi:hypothetical protein